MIVFPIKAINIAKLNAVPDTSLNISPTIPNITGKPGANPAPRTNMPIELKRYPFINNPAEPNTNSSNDRNISLL